MCFFIKTASVHVLRQCYSSVKDDTYLWISSVVHLDEMKYNTNMLLEQLNNL